MSWLAVDLASDVLHLDAGASRKLDPYWGWAELTRWQGFTNVADFGLRDQVAFIAKIRDGEDLARCLAELPFEVNVPATYTQPVAGTPESGARCFTGRVPRQRIAQLLAQPWLERFELGAPVAAASPASPGARRGLGPGLPGPAVRSLNRGGVIGVIDDACAVFHPCFRDAGGASRVRHLWDQGNAAANEHWCDVRGFRYGREWIPAERPVGSEVEAYLAMQYLLASDGASGQRAFFATHGTHVLHLAAGHPDPLHPDVDARDPAAAHCDLIFVGLPDQTVTDSSGGSLPVHLLDGLRYVLDHCRVDEKVVVSISYGSQAGPHDGSSLIETAMDELQAGRPQMAIAISAGNSRKARAHARLDVASRAPQQFQWKLEADDTTDSFLEIWYPRPAKGRLTVRVVSPEGEDSTPVAPDGCAVLGAPDNPRAALIHRQYVPNGNDAMALLALAPTRPSGARAGAQGGVWTIHLQTDSALPVEVHAYVERDDPGPRSTKRPSRLLGAAVEEAGTLNGLATGKNVVVAGAMYYRGATGEQRKLDYSSLGPARRIDRGLLPTVMAASEENPSQPGIRAAAVRGTDSFRMGGTSVAAPVVARRLINHLLAPAREVGADALLTPDSTRFTSAAAKVGQ